MGRGLNLPQEYFHCPELSRREKQYLIQKAQDSAKALVESARSSHGPVRWIEAGSHKGVQMYKGEGRHPNGSAEQIQYVCGATTVQATIEEVAAFMDVSSTPKFKAYVPHQHELLDGVVLYTLVAPSPENQFLHQVTVKWQAAHVPSKLIKDRDFLTLECQDVFTDTTGRRGWVRSYHSVKLPCCPDLQTELGFVRGSFYHTGYVFVESERPGWLDCIHTCQVNLKGNLKLPSSIYFLAMKRRIGSVAELGRTLQQRRLGKHNFLSDLELVPKSHRTRCHVCAAKFGMITRKSRCRKCGEVVCHQCTQTWEISLAKAGVKKVRVCATCASSNDLNTAPQQQTADEISLLSSDNQSVSQHSDDQQTDPEYFDHQQPLQLKSTMLEDPHFASRQYGFSPSSAMEASPQRHHSSIVSRPPPPRPSLGHPSRRGPVPYDQDPYRPIGFKHHSEYDHPRYDNTPGRRGHSYSREYRDEYDDYDRGYAPAPGMPPRYRESSPYRDEYRYRDERDYDYYPPPPPPHDRDHLPPSRRYPSEGRQRPPSLERPSPGKFRHAHTNETVSSSPDSRNSGERSLTAHALERHTRQMGRPGPVPPHAYDYDRPGPPSSHHSARSPYQAPPYHNDYPPPGPYRDSGQSRGPPLSHEEMSFAQHGCEDQRPSFYDDSETVHFDQGYQPPPVRNSRERLAPAYEQPKAIPERAPSTRESSSVKAQSVQDETSRASRSTSPEHEVSDALAVNAARLMQQQQEIQGQLHARAQALSFSSEQRYDPDEDDYDEEGEGGVDGLEDWSTGSPTSRAMLNEFKSLQMDDASRSTLDSYRFSVTASSVDTRISFAPTEEPSTRLSQDFTNDYPNDSGVTMTTTSDVDKLSVVQLYQKILELTKKQHAIETNPHVDPAEKDAVAKELSVLYKKLNEVTAEAEVVF